MPELITIATGKEPRPLQLDSFAAAFSSAGEKQEKTADEKTLVLLQRFSGNPYVEKARMEFERAQEIEETFHKDFDGIDFTSRSTDGRTSLRISCEQFREFSEFSELRSDSHKWRVVLFLPKRAHAPL